jgi:predicted 2-oxoglutarate/Fe(II)-dependent dioxygenase YbiX
VDGAVASAIAGPMIESEQVSACVCGSGKAFLDCCGNSDAPYWNEQASGRIAGTFFDPQFRRYVEKEAVCRLGGVSYPPGILVRRLDSDYGLQAFSVTLVTAKRVRAAMVKEANQAQMRISNRVTEIVDQGALAGGLIELVRKAYAREIEPFFNCRLRSLETPQVLRYTRGSHYKPHSDSDVIDPGAQRWRKAQDRDYSLLIHLDDDYEGGDLIFPNFDFRLRPRAGMLVAFPSDCRYLHGAMPVLSGVRHAIVSWCAVQ